MKKILISLLIALGLIGFAQAVTVTVTNSLGQVIVYEVTDTGVTIQSITTSGGSTGSVSFLPVIGFQVGYNIADITAFTPRGVGDMLLDVYDGDVWIAKGLSANSWSPVSRNPQVSTATTVNPTSFTARYVGDMLIGTVSNVVYISESTGTAGWIKVSN